MNINSTCCLTGHRPKSLPWGYNEDNINCKKFKRDISLIFIEVIKHGKDIFLLGMAEGFDMIGAEILIGLRKKYNIQIIGIIPCENQEIKWSQKQQKRYNKILKHCNEVIILQKEYTYDCMNKRNYYMVDNSSVVIACYNGKPSGTKNTIKYAEEKGCKIIIINPNEYK